MAGYIIGHAYGIFSRIFLPPCSLAARWICPLGNFSLQSRRDAPSSRQRFQPLDFGLTMNFWHSPIGTDDIDSNAFNQIVIF